MRIAVGDRADRSALLGLVRQPDGELLDEVGREHDEHGAEQRPRHGADTADEQDRDELDGEHEAELGGGELARQRGEQRTGDAGEERAGGEGDHLVLELRHAHHLGGDVAVADGLQRPAGAGAGDVLGDQDEHQQQHAEEEVLLLRVG